MAAAGARVWSTLESSVRRQWPTWALAGLAAVAGVMAVLVAALGLHPGFAIGFAAGLVALLAWSAFGLRAAVGEPELGRWRRLLTMAELQGRVAAVDVGSEPLTAAVAEIVPDAHLSVLDPESHVAVRLDDATCDAVVIGPRVTGLDEAARETLIDDARRVLRPGGRLVLVVPASSEPRGLPQVAAVEWQPGAPPGWWSDPLAEHFEEVRHARLSRRLLAVLATRVDGRPF